MADEPLYCRTCGAEDWSCGHSYDGDDRAGPYCEVCGVIPAPGRECHFMRPGGLRTGCETEEKTDGN